MNEADFAIVTPSVTVNEIVYMAVPFIAIQTASNQLYMTEYLEKNNYFVLNSFDAISLNNNISKLMDLQTCKNQHKKLQDIQWSRP